MARNWWTRFDVDIVEIITWEKYIIRTQKTNERIQLVEDMTQEVDWLLLPAMCIENPDDLAILVLLKI